MNKMNKFKKQSLTDVQKALKIGDILVTRNGIEAEVYRIEEVYRGCTCPYACFFSFVIFTDKLGKQSWSQNWNYLSEGDHPLDIVEIRYKIKKEINNG